MKETKEDFLYAETHFFWKGLCIGSFACQFLLWPLPGSYELGHVSMHHRSFFETNSACFWVLKRFFFNSQTVHTCIKLSSKATAQRYTFFMGDTLCGMGAKMSEKIIENKSGGEEDVILYLPTISLCLEDFCFPAETRKNPWKDTPSVFVGF